MSREALSLEISQLVARVVNGEAIDTAERGEALARKYPDLGMSGRLIGQAIDRAAGMVGMIREAPEPPRPSRSAAPAAPAIAPAAPALAEPTERKAPPVRPFAGGAAPVPLAASKQIDDELAAAIDAEIGILVSGHSAASAAAGGRVAAPKAPSIRREGPKAPVASTSASTVGEADLAAAQRAAAAMDAKQDGASRPIGRVAAFRRALFGI